MLIWPSLSASSNSVPPWSDGYPWTAANASNKVATPNRTRSLPSTALFWPIGSVTRPPSIPFWGSFATPRSRASAWSKPAPARAILRPSQPRLTSSREPPKRSAPRGSPLQLHCSSAPAKPATTVPAARALDLWRASCAARWPRLMARVELTRWFARHDRRLRWGGRRTAQRDRRKRDQTSTADHFRVPAERGGRRAVPLGLIG